MVIKMGEGVYKCTGCGDTITVDDPRAVPVIALIGKSGSRVERVITVNDVEVHRCWYRAPATEE